MTTKKQTWKECANEYAEKYLALQEKLREALKQFPPEDRHSNGYIMVEALLNEEREIL